MKTYIETFDDGPGGWFGWIDNARGPKPLERGESCVISRSPWWIDYNQAPPGAGYMHLLFMLLTSGSPGENQREVSGENRFIKSGFGTDFTKAELTLRLKGELLARDTQLLLLCQGVHRRICTGWLLTGQPITVTPDWSEQKITAVTDESAWTCLGSRHDRADYVWPNSVANGAQRRQRGYPAGAVSAGCRTHGTAERRSPPSETREGLPGLA